MERNSSTRLNIKKHLETIEEISELSKDPFTKVGCVLLNKEGKPVSCGYNNQPFNWFTKFPWEDRDEKNKFVIHAEINAVANLREDPYYAIVTLFPCCNCAKALIASGVKEIYYKDIRMNEDACNVITLCYMTGVKLIKIEK